MSVRGRVSPRVGVGSRQRTHLSWPKPWLHSFVSFVWPWQAFRRAVTFCAGVASEKNVCTRTSSTR